MSVTSVRKPYQGVLQILQFNWPQYAVAAVVISATLTLLPFVHSFWRAAMVLALIPATFWLLSSLVVSHYIYDRFPLYDLRWITRSLGKRPANWINIHCGLDETSDLLSTLFTDASGQVVKIYDPAIMTEGSIAKAQDCGRPALPFTQGCYDSLGVSADHFDAAFLFFAAHELRQHNQRVEMFREVKRVLLTNGDLFLIEHTRDLWNFIAFGPGFLHFFSDNAWQRAVNDAGLVVTASFPMTRFVRVYHLRKSA